MPTPIKTAYFHHDDQEESNSNFQTVVLYQLSLIMHITQSLGKRMTKVERDVADIKRFMALFDDDVNDMVIDDTPPNSPGDNPPPPYLHHQILHHLLHHLIHLLALLHHLLALLLNLTLPKKGIIIKGVLISKCKWW